MSVDKILAEFMPHWRLDWAGEVGNSRLRIVCYGTVMYPTTSRDDLQLVVEKDATNKFGAYCNRQTWCTSADHDCVKCREDFESGYKAAIAALTPQFGDAVPTEPGWYWWLERGCLQVECVHAYKTPNRGDELVVSLGAPYGTLEVEKVGGQWAKATPPESKGGGK